jgi:predicted small lipoprotein YifL
MRNGKLILCAGALAFVSLSGCGRQEPDTPPADPMTDAPQVTVTEPATAEEPVTQTLTATLSGTTGPTEGDADGSGTAQVVINENTGELCYQLTVENIEPATMAHIHVGGSDETGGVVVPLDAPTEGMAEGCLTPDAETVGAILQNPEGYYVNVHNEPFPGGAVRGQLTR